MEVMQVKETLIWILIVNRSKHYRDFGGLCIVNT